MIARRWAICALLSCASMANSLLWTAWPSISAVAGPYFGWDQQAFDYLSSWGPATFVPLAFFAGVFVERVGLRWTIHAAILTIAVGCSLRAASVFFADAASGSKISLILAHLGQLFASLSGPLVLATPPAISQAWFPTTERMVATSIMVAANYFGPGLGFVAAIPVKSIRQMQMLIVGEAIACIVLAIISLADDFILKFPRLPADAPSKSNQLQRDDKESAKRNGVLTETWIACNALIRNKQFMLLALATGISQGLYGGWSSVIAPTLKKDNIPETASNYLGFASTCGTVVGCLIGGMFLGRKSPRYVIFAALCISATCFFGFTYLVASQHHAGAAAYATNSIGAAAVVVTSAIGFESGVETTFPMSEAYSASFLCIFFNLNALVLSLLAPSLSGEAVNGLVAGGSAAGAVLILFFDPPARRREIDEAPSALYQVLE